MFIQIPRLGFQTPKVYQTVYAQNIEYQRRGEYTVDYLTIEHSTELDLMEDFILHGHYRDPGFVDYFIEPVIQDGENKKIQVYEIAANVWMASAEFERPFDYSTSNWVSSGACEKDVQKIKPVASSRSSRPVSVMILKSSEQFRYFLKASENPPFFRFTVPANTSILPYHFQGQGPVLLLNESLSAVLASSPTDTTWKIHIKGKMTGCPAYLAVIVNSRLDFEELCHYDLLILCPAEFNITINIPKKDHEPSSIVTFDIRLQDIEKNYSIFLTHVFFREPLMTPTNRVVIDDAESKHSSLVIFGIIVSTVLTLLVFSVFYFYLEFLKRQYWMDREFRKSESYLTWPGAFSFRAFVMAAFILTKVLYSLIFTFSILMWIFLLLTKSDFLRLLTLDQFQAEQRNVSTQLFLEMEQASQAELFRKCELMDAHISSCRHYISDLLFNMSEAMATAHQMPWQLARGSYISSLIRERTQMQLNFYSNNFSEYAEHYRSKVTSSLLPSVRKYKSFLDSVFQNDLWFSFPQTLFNLSQQTSGKKFASREAPVAFGFLTDFGLFLEVEEIEEVSLWFHKFLKRFNASLPEMPVFPQVLPNSTCCGSNSIILLSSLVHNARLHLLDTFRFFTTRSYPNDFDGSAGLKDLPDIDAVPSTVRKKNIFQPDGVDVLTLFQGTLAVPCLWIFCIILDVLLLSYRISHIFLSARRIQATLSYDSKNMYSLYKQMQQSNGRTPHGDELCLQFHDDVILPSRRLQDEVVPAVTDSQSCFTHHNVHDDVDFVNSHAKCLMGTVVVVFFTSRALPKVLVAVALVAFFCTFIRTCGRMLAPEMLCSAGIFSTYVLPVAVHVNLTNTFVIDQIQHYHQVTTAIYRNQMSLDIRNLQGLLTFFNSEQSYAAEKYLAEACSLLSYLSSNVSCDVSTSFLPLSITILPCNFVPVQPQFYTGYQASVHRQQLLKAIEPFTTSVVNILRTSETLVLVTVAVILLVNLSTWTLFHYLRVQHNRPPMCTISPKTTVRLQVFRRSKSRTSENRTASSLIAYQPASTRECFEPELHFTELNPVSLPSSNPVPLPVRPCGRLIDVGYSETNV